MYLCLKDFYKSPNNKIYFPNKSSSHNRINAELMNFKTELYPYYDQTSKKINLESFENFLRELDRGSIVFMQPINHNPTGAYLELPQWHKVAKLCQEN